MSEKVLGIKVNKAKFAPALHWLFDSNEKEGKVKIWVNTKDLVPIVSVAWLEKELDRIKESVRENKGGTDYALGKNVGKFNLCSYLLKAVREQAKGGKE